MSASSMTSVLQDPRRATPLSARSRMRPGVATTMWTGWYRRMMSSRREVPPVVTMTWTARCLPRVLAT